MLHNARRTVRNISQNQQQANTYFFHEEILLWKFFWWTINEDSRWGFNSLQLFLILGKGNEMLLKTKPKQAFRKIYTCISRATFDKGSQRRLQTTPYSKPQKDEKRLFIAHNI